MQQAAPVKEDGGTSSALKEDGGLYGLLKGGRSSKLLLRCRNRVVRSSKLLLGRSRLLFWPKAGFCSWPKPASVLAKSRLFFSQSRLLLWPKPALLWPKPAPSLAKDGPTGLIQY